MQWRSLTSWGLNTLSKDHSLVVTKEHGNLWYHGIMLVMNILPITDKEKDRKSIPQQLPVSKHFNHSIYFDVQYYEGFGIILNESFSLIYSQ